MRILRKIVATICVLFWIPIYLILAILLALKDTAILFMNALSVIWKPIERKPFIPG